MMDSISKVWHLVRIAGLHEGDVNSKDVQRAVESVVKDIVSAGERGFRSGMSATIDLAQKDAERRGAERALEWVAEYCDEMYDKAILIEEGLAALYPNETEST